MSSIIKEVLSNNEESNLMLVNQLSNTIAISISPFDRFPHVGMYRSIGPTNRYRNEELFNKYSYLGLRDSQYSNFSQAYMSKIIFSLVNSLFLDKTRIVSLMNILDYIGYQKSLILNFRFSHNWEKLKRYLDKESLLEDDLMKLHSFFSDITESKNNYLKDFFFNKDDSLKDKEYTMDILEVLKKIPYMKRKNMELRFLGEDYTLFKELNIYEDDIRFLLKSDILRLNDVILVKKDTKNIIKINEASSGEQSIIMSILGITSKIRDGSLICIDEPEICLHPTWQEKYIKLLTHTFKDYKGCHFLIATHSPQIISKLEDENCYVMSMEDGKIVNASTLNNRSIDFQLAHVFKSPGFKNEYLTRELISLITLISEGKGQEELASSKIEEILALKDVIDDDDPVKELIKMVASVKKELS
ncbi:MAG TPA: hypothetical protein ENK66_00690 [Arcobacter sp.]|nr:hypothetical protein [Arcobacter sp.]